MVTIHDPTHRLSLTLPVTDCVAAAPKFGGRERAGEKIAVPTSPFQVGAPEVGPGTHDHARISLQLCEPESVAQFVPPDEAMPMPYQPMKGSYNGAIGPSFGRGSTKKMTRQRILSTNSVAGASVGEAPAHLADETEGIRTKLLRFWDSTFEKQLSAAQADRLRFRASVGSGRTRPASMFILAPRFAANSSAGGAQAIRTFLQQSTALRNDRI
jgi:hypothetical protein